MSVLVFPFAPNSAHPIVWVGPSVPNFGWAQVMDATMPSTITDVELVTRCQAGDEAAQACFCDRYGKLILDRARRLKPSGKEPEDVAHDVLMEIFYGNSRFRGEGGGLRSWLHRIVSSKSRSRRMVDRLSDFFTDGSGAAIPKTLTFDDPLLAEAVAALLSELPFGQQEALVLCDVEDRSAREAAELVGVPEGTIRSRLRLGRQAMAKKLARQGLDLRALEVV